MYNTTFVTAFFDINRSSWKALFPRSNKAYLSYFSRLSKLKNDIIVFTSGDMVDVIKEECQTGDNVRFVTVDFNQRWGSIVESVRKVQQSKEFKSQFSERQLRSPEYSIPEYVTVTTRKIELVQEAIDKGLVKTEQVAWIDFGYARKDVTMNGLEFYQSPWDDDKIHMFNRTSLDNVGERELRKALLYNRVYFMGGSVVGKKPAWSKLNKIYYECFDEILEQGLADDDQGYFMASYLKDQDLFSTDFIPHDWFPLFKFKQ
jgi:protein YibB